MIIRESDSTDSSGSIAENIHFLSRMLGQKLSEKNWKIATAESCTGGGIAAAITQVAGSSQWFEYGIVSYANSAKIKILKVDEKILGSEGAVSEAVVQQMLMGLLELSEANIGVAVSGVAGPSGSEGKPVGGVWFALGEHQNFKTLHKKFFGDRIYIQQQSIEFALNELIHML